MWGGVGGEHSNKAATEVSYHNPVVHPNLVDSGKCTQTWWTAENAPKLGGQWKMPVTSVPRFTSSSWGRKPRVLCCTTTSNVHTAA